LALLRSLNPSPVIFVHNWANLTSASFVAINKIVSYNNGAPKLRNIDYRLTIIFSYFVFLISLSNGGPVASPSTNNKYRNNLDLASKVFAEHDDFIRAVIRSQVKNEVQADDIFQDLFLSLVYNPVPKGVKNMKSYLYRAIINDVVDAVRRVETYKAQIYKYRRQPNYSINKTGPGNAIAGPGNAIAKEELDRVFALIKGRLRNNEYQAITLRYKDHYGIKDVAERMGVKCKSAREYTSRGLRKIREFLMVK
jgi:RNA polymerase sigma factor (sigma-70 family)